VKSTQLILTLLDEAYEKQTWHGPRLHNIWEETLHAAYWKYAVRRRIEGGKRGSFALKGSNFFPRPEPGKSTEAAWRADKELLGREHRALRSAISKVLPTPHGAKLRRQLYGVTFHDVYHAGQIRLLRRLMNRL
jgi:hypothetical protein